MLKQEILLNNNLKLSIILKDDRTFIVDKIFFLKDDKVRYLYADGVEVVEGQILSFDHPYSFKIINIISKEEEDSTGIFSSISKKSLVHVDKKKYYDLKIDTSSSSKVKIDPTTNLVTSFFNQVPLFYKFVIENVKIDFKNDEFKIFDIDGNPVVNYAVNSYGDIHTIFIDIKANNKYFYTHNGNTSEAILYKTTQSRLYSETLSGNHLVLPKSVYMDSVSVYCATSMPDDLYLKITYDDDSVKTLDIKTTNVITDYITDKFISIKDFVKRIDLYSKTKSVNDFYNSNNSIIWFNDSRVEKINGEFYYKKTNNLDYLFTSIELEDINEDKLDFDFQKMEYGKTYFLTNNILTEHKEGNISVSFIEKTDISILNYIDYPEDIPYEDFLKMEVDNLQEDLKKYYDRNFKSVDSVIKYGDA